MEEVIEFKYRKPVMTRERQIAIRLMKIARQVQEDEEKLKATLEKRRVTH